MLWNLQVNNFMWIKANSEFNGYFLENCNEESKEGYFLEVNIQYPEKLHELHNGLPIIPERMKIQKV